MANIYELSQELLDIFNIIEDNGGELTPELEEKLNITEESFKDKIKDYCNVVKMLQNDIVNIKEEKARLNDLQKSKENTIERLKQIIINAVETFGDNSKTGSKFIDYGIGKVSIRNSQIVEVDEDSTNRFVNRYITALNRYNMMNQLDMNILAVDELIDYVNSQSPEEEEDNVEITKFTSRDLESLDAVVNLDIPFADLINSKKGFELAKALINFGLFEIKSKVNKTNIKREAKENNFIPTFAKLTNNQSIIIK